jgi:hypothetical protein
MPPGLKIPYLRGMARGRTLEAIHRNQKWPTAFLPYIALQELNPFCKELVFNGVPVFSFTADGPGFRQRVETLDVQFSEME